MLWEDPYVYLIIKSPILRRQPEAFLPASASQASWLCESKFTSLDRERRVSGSLRKSRWKTSGNGMLSDTCEITQSQQANMLLFIFVLYHIEVESLKFVFLKKIQLIPMIWHCSNVTKETYWKTVFSFPPASPHLHISKVTCPLCPRKDNASI